MDTQAAKVVEMYTKYPFPAKGNYHDYFERNVLPAMLEIDKETPIHRVLDAGCGTGAITCDIARLLPEVEVVGVDFTEESLRVARSRARARKLKIKFLHTDLLQHDGALGEFDFVYCQGVIHHLTDPLAGLRNLNRYLLPGRHAFIWIYALLGRRWILDLREALSLLPASRGDWEERVALASRVQSLFAGKRGVVHMAVGVLRHLKSSISSEGAVRGEIEASAADVHLADMLLHPQDKFYRFREAVSEFEKAGFSFVRVLQGMPNTLRECFGPAADELARGLGPMEAYTLIELSQRPGGIGYLVRKD
jgi:SAM-dependent methyltransferase